jgi:non-specific serine/threonine protein kinase/serine/threonine-protein kinase
MSGRLSNAGEDYSIVLNLYDRVWAPKPDIVTSPQEKHLPPRISREDVGSSPFNGGNLADTEIVYMDVGTVGGRYNLVQKVGEGGMGEVWLAEQNEPIRRRVAIKLIKAGMDTREVVKRFESERQALALMDHPAIAKVFDAGSTVEGRPYFVMEYVRGAPITDYCDKNKLTVRQRLELFVRVCEGVQHAHQKAIIHRDLKPSNILVGEVDGTPSPRIIDFGVAKAIAQLTVATMLTRLGAVVGTTGYMSPEQADSRGEDVDTRTDVYSLGVVFYELLVGTLPLDFRKVPLDQIGRKLREEDATPPSTTLRPFGEESRVIALDRGTDALTLARQLRGDLDAIALKALEKDPSRRYATPLELAADIRRYLCHEPVIARRASGMYRATRYIRRHRIAVAMAVAAIVLLASFAVDQSFQRRRNQRERDRANRVTDFMTEMFKVSNPSEARGMNVTAREILDKASKDIENKLAGDPELQARMLDVIGSVFYDLGLYSRAHPLFERAVQTRVRVLGVDNPETLLSKHHLAATLDGEGRFKRAEMLDRETLEARRRVLGLEHPDTLRSMSNLASTIEREARDLSDTDQQARLFSEAEKEEREILAIRRRVLGTQHPDTLVSMTNLASTLDNERQYLEAERLQRETIEIQRRVLGPEKPETLGSMNNLAFSLERQHLYAEAESLYKEALQIQRRVLGPDHPITLLSMDNLADTLAERKKYAESERLYRETVDGRRRALGPDHPDTARSTYELACVVARQGRHDEALSLLRNSIDHGLDSGSVLDLEKDDDLKSLHGNPRFEALVAYARERQ